jgi:hypothetical protein
LAGQKCCRCPRCGYLLWFQTPERSPNPQLVARTKEPIRSLVGEIAQRSQEDLALEEYLGEFLPRVITALAAVGGVVWLKGGDDQLALRYQVNLRGCNLREASQESQRRHGRLLLSVLDSGEGMLIQPGAGLGNVAEEDNPTWHLLVIGTLKTAGEAVGIVEIFQRTEAGPAVQRGYLRFVNEMCHLAGNSLALKRHVTSLQDQASKKRPWWKFWK